MTPLTHILGTLILVSALTQAEQPIRMGSFPELSPDGSSILFSWHGDIWTASSKGGKAERLTTHPAQDYSPKFTPDGQSICFGSTRAGKYQIFIKSIKGGPARQLTYHSEGSRLDDIAPDGKSLLIRGARDFTGRKPYRFYRIDLEGNQPEQLIFNAYSENGRYSPDGKSIIFTRDGSRTYRKGYHGTQASKVWTWNTKGQNTFHEPVSSDFGCATPFYHADGKSFFYTQGAANGFNLWNYDIGNKKSTQITHFEDDSVLQPAIARNGSALIFRHLFDFYLLPLNTPSSETATPQKLDLWHTEDLDEKNEQDRIINTTSDITFSPSGLEIAFTADGDIWAMDTILRKPQRLTDTSGFEKDIWFSHDGKSIFYLYDDGIQTEIRKLEKSDPQQYWWKAKECTHSVIVKTDQHPTSVTPGPKGKKLAYTTYPGNLWISDLDGKNPVRMLESWDTPSVKWSPDGKWLAYSLHDNNFNPDIFIINSDGSSAPVNISSHPNLDFNPVWSPNGRRLAFIGKHYGKEIDIFYVELYKKDEVEDSDAKTREKAVKAMKKDPAYQDDSKPSAKKIVQKAIKAITQPNDKKQSGKDADKDAKDKKKQEPFDLKNIHQRLHRIKIKGEAPTKLIWSHDSKNILFQQLKGKSIYSVEAKSKGKIIKLADVTGSPIHMTSKGKLYWLSKNIPAVFANKKSTPYPFKIFTSRDRSAWKRMVFRSAWNTMRDQFYDPIMNGRDWDAIRTKYEDMAALAPDSITMDRIVNLMLGELNASHMGFRGTTWPRPWKRHVQWIESTQHLGVRFDTNHTGKGWKIATVIPRSPADRAISKLNPGEIILTVGGEEVSPSTPITSRLNLREKEPILLLVSNLKGEEREVKITPVTYPIARELVKKAQLDATAEEVDRLSGGKLGYVHVARMMWDEFEKFQQHLYQQGVGKEGLVIDVRDNGGGFTTDHLLTALCQPNHAFTIARNGGVGYPQDRTVYTTWNKPIIVLCNQNSFSNAEIFAHAIRALNRGKIVGIATAGGVISTGSIKVMDAGTMRLPFRGWFSSVDGKDMELNGAQPHITIWNKPGERSQGKDIQLEKAVQVLLEDTKNAQPHPKPRYRSSL